MPATPPSKSSLDQFMQDSNAALPDENGITPARIRCIGWNVETSNSICDHVVAREKIGTFSVPWLHESHPETKPNIGEFVVLADYEGVPRALLQVIALRLVKFKDIDETHTGLDGPSVRALDIWRPMHTKYWNGMLEELGKEVEAEMPVIVEEFVCRYPAG